MAEINSVQEASKRVAMAIDRCSSTICEIDAVSETVSLLVQRQSEEVAKINDHANQAANETAKVAQNIGRTSAAAEQTRDATDVLLTSAQGLSQHAASLSSSVDQFLASIRQNHVGV